MKSFYQLRKAKALLKYIAQKISTLDGLWISLNLIRNWKIIFGQSDTSLIIPLIAMIIFSCSECSLSIFFHSPYLYFFSTHTHRTAAKSRESERERFQCSKQTPVHGDLYQHNYTHNLLTVFIARCYAVCSTGAAVLVSGHLHTSLDFVGASQLQLTHSQRRTAFLSNRFACHTFSLKKSSRLSKASKFSTSDHLKR